MLTKIENGLAFVLADISDIFNYADDNTACCYDTTVQQVLKKLYKCCKMFRRDNNHFAPLELLF